MNSLEKILVEKKSCKSIWFMRQAGRYLPEFRKIRSKNQNFIQLCLNSKLSSEITLQPIKRFNLDSAIIFSDILMTPYALGQEVEFIKETGPKLSDFNLNFFLDIDENTFSRKLNPVYNAIELTRNKLDKKKSLIAFIGAPWTLLVYMFNLKINKNKINLKNLANVNIDVILEKLINFSCLHIENQIKAGANVIQIFDSWAGLVENNNFGKFCLIPNTKITEFCKRKNIPNISFPKGIKDNYKIFNQTVKPDGINIDYEVDPLWAKKELTNVVIQGGLDPKYLLRSDDELFKAATKYIKTFKDSPYVFNLGHGLLPETDPDKLNKLINFYRNFNE